MSSVASVRIHASQFPAAVRRDLVASLRTRQVNHKFHYDSVKQTQKWLALHEAFSPSRTDPDCLEMYDAAFAAAVRIHPASPAHVVGLGCGGGQKDTQLLRQLIARGVEATYTPCDVSTAMVLVARNTALSAISEEKCFPLVCDLLSAEDLPGVIATDAPPDAARLITFFGMVPNFEPSQVLPKLAGMMTKDDLLLLSANLAPGPDYLEGLQRILPQYDNARTRDWLMTFLLDLGIEPSAGELQFSVREFPRGSGLNRVEAGFRLSRSSRIQVGDDLFDFESGEIIRLFFSYRYTPVLIRGLLGEQGIEVKEHRITKSGEEGVFLCLRS